MRKLLDEDLIKLGIDLPDWEAAVGYGSELLQRKGYVKEGYKERLIEREKTYPTGLQGKSIGIAVPHTSADYTIRPSICILIPIRPVRFHAMGEKDLTVDVQLIIQLAIEGDGMQLKLLRSIMQLLRDDEMLQRLLKSRDKKELLELLTPVLED